MGFLFCPQTSTKNGMSIVILGAGGQLGPLPARADVHVWAGADLARTVLRVGLADWVIEKVA